MNFHLIDQQNHASVDLDLPILVNVGTQIEHATGTYIVKQIIKMDGDINVICIKDLDNAWILDFLNSKEIKILNYNVPV